VMVKNMERVNIYGQMEIFMMENGVKIKWMVKELIHGLMDVPIMENG
jgi:hypothetical protein